MPKPLGLTRRAVALALAGSLLGSLSADGTEGGRTFTIDATGIKDLRDLITAMKKAAGRRWSASVSLQAYYEGVSKSFVEHAHAAAAAGIRGIPPWLLEKIPKRRVGFTILVAIAVGGVTFLVPLSVLAWTVIGSLALLTVYIYRAIDAMTRDKPLKA